MYAQDSSTRGQFHSFSLAIFSFSCEEPLPFRPLEAPRNFVVYVPWLVVTLCSCDSIEGRNPFLTSIFMIACLTSLPSTQYTKNSMTPWRPFTIVFRYINVNRTPPFSTAERWWNFQDKILNTVQVYSLTNPNGMTIQCSKIMNPLPAIKHVNSLQTFDRIS